MSHLASIFDDIAVHIHIDNSALGPDQPPHSTTMSSTTAIAAGWMSTACQNSPIDQLKWLNHQVRMIFQIKQNQKRPGL